MMSTFKDISTEEKTTKSALSSSSSSSSSDSEDSGSSSEGESSSTSSQKKQQTNSPQKKPQFSVTSSGLKMKIAFPRNATPQPSNSRQQTDFIGGNNAKRLPTKKLVHQKPPEHTKSGSESDSSWCSNCDSDESEASSTRAVQNAKNKGSSHIDRKKNASHEGSSSSGGGTDSSDSDSSDDALQEINAEDLNAILPHESNNSNENSNLKSTKRADTTTVRTPNVDDNGSSSDMELPALVNAAIRRVESESDAESVRTVPQVQYTSSLLQDFIAKAQMLGKATNDPNTRNGSKLDQSQQQKKRGRPKSQIQPSSSNYQHQPQVGNGSLISESPDSGILSTVSPAPSPKVLDVTKASLKQIQAPSRAEISKRSKQSLAKSPTPKYNLASLEKSTYATERVLYPPRRKKPGRPPKENNSKKEDKLDPKWNKIDLNKKFREPCIDGYKSDGGHSICCSKRLAAQSGYVSDYYGTSRRKNLSGYKSDHSMKSRRSGYFTDRSIRAKSCGYRSDCSTRHRKKVRRKRRKKIGLTSKSGIDELNEILQLGALTLGTSSNTSSSHESIPTEKSDSVNAKPKDKEKIIPLTTFSGIMAASKPTFGSSATTVSLSLGQASAFGKKLTIQKSTKLPLSRANVQKNAEEHAKRKSTTKDLLHNLCERVTQRISENDSASINPTVSVKSKSVDGHSVKSRKTIHGSHHRQVDKLRECSGSIRSRRLSTMSRCSSRSTMSRHHFKRRRRKRLKSRSISISGQNKTNDTKILLEIEQLSESFKQMCKIYVDKADKTTEKIVKGTGSSKKGPRKRKQSESVDVSSVSTGTTSTKRRNKKSHQLTQSPDDHKLPLKKRHYLLANGDKAEISDDDIEEGTFKRKTIQDSKEVERIKSHYDEAIEACINKYTSNSPVVKEKVGHKETSKNVSPKKRHLLKTSEVGPTSNKTPLSLDKTTTMNHSLTNADSVPNKSTNHIKKSESQTKKKIRLENVVSKISPVLNEKETRPLETKTKTSKKFTPSPEAKTVTKKLRSDPSNFKSSQQIEQLPLQQKRKTSESLSNKKGKVESLSSKPATKTLKNIDIGKKFTSKSQVSYEKNNLKDASIPIVTVENYPPPGVFEPSFDLELQIPVSTINLPSIVQSRTDVSPSSGSRKKQVALSKTTEKVVEKLLTKTGGHLLLKKKRRKAINRTGFPTKKKRKRIEVEPERNTKICDRVPSEGENTAQFIERNKSPNKLKQKSMANGSLERSPSRTLRTRDKISLDSNEPQDNVKVTVTDITKKRSREDVTTQKSNKKVKSTDMVNPTINKLRSPRDISSDNEPLINYVRSSSRIRGSEKNKENKSNSGTASIVVSPSQSPAPKRKRLSHKSPSKEISEAVKKPTKDLSGSIRVVDVKITHDQTGNKKSDKGTIRKTGKEFLEDKKPLKESSDAKKILKEPDTKKSIKEIKDSKNSIESQKQIKELNDPKKLSKCQLETKKPGRDQTEVKKPLKDSHDSKKTTKDLTDVKTSTKELHDNKKQIKPTTPSKTLSLEDAMKEKNKLTVSIEKLPEIPPRKIKPNQSEDNKELQETPKSRGRPVTKNIQPITPPKGKERLSRLEQLTKEFNQKFAVVKLRSLDDSCYKNTTNNAELGDMVKRRPRSKSVARTLSDKDYIATETTYDKLIQERLKSKPVRSPIFYTGMQPAELMETNILETRMRSRGKAIISELEKPITKTEVDQRRRAKTPGPVSVHDQDKLNKNTKESKKPSVDKIAETDKQKVIKKGKSLASVPVSTVMDSADVTVPDPEKEAQSNNVESTSSTKKVQRGKKQKIVEEVTQHNEVKPLPDQDDLEQDPLPLESGVEISLYPESAIEKERKLKKKYLVAGLFSDYYKEDPKTNKLGSAKTNVATTNTVPSAICSIPPPPYCEKYFRRTIQDFLLPYDIWLASNTGKLVRSETLASWHFRKLRVNVYANDVRPNPIRSGDRQICSCKPGYDCAENCLNRLVYTECSVETCPCGDKCKNTKIQRHEFAPGLEKFMTSNKGWGVRCKQPIKKSSFISEYCGEVVTEKEFKERMQTLYISDQHHYCLNLDKGLVIDGHRMGSDCRFVNHSCAPNCEMQKWSVNGLSRMCLFALRDIEPMEELTYDYNFALFNPTEGQECMCGAKHCRGVIGGKSQRLKPVPEADKHSTKTTRSRKQKAKKNQPFIPIKYGSLLPAFIPPTEHERAVIAEHHCFLMRNLRKVRRNNERPICSLSATNSQTATVSPTPAVNKSSSLSVPMAAVRTPRNIRTRGLAVFEDNPELEKSARVAVILRGICDEIHAYRIDDKEPPAILKLSLPSKKKCPLYYERIPLPIDLAQIESNVEKGVYNNPRLFDEDIMRLFGNAIKYYGTLMPEGITAMKLLEFYKSVKEKAAEKLDIILGEKALVDEFMYGLPKPTPIKGKKGRKPDHQEEIISCICGLYKDEGIMIQCSKCNVWQHIECVNADPSIDNYLCEKCDPKEVNYEITLNEEIEEGRQYYLSLMRGDLQVRQGDTVYVLRDIPLSPNKQDPAGPVKKHNYQTIGEVDFSQCDIFRVERLWIDENGKRQVYGHHYLRPHETFHEPTRKFYPNEILRSPLYEVVPIELIMGRCWVLDPNTFCKGRPADSYEPHVYICELRVDKSASQFAKVAKHQYPTCTKTYAFHRFEQKLKIAKTFAPHDVKDVPIPKERKRRKPEEVQMVSRKTSPVIQLLPPPPKTISEKRGRLEDVLARLMNIKVRILSNKILPPVDLSYLLTGRGARSRRTNNATPVPT